MSARERLLARKSERGTTVVVVVMVTTLITAIGVFAVRNVSQIDRAVGYSRQAAQTNAIAELGTSAALAQVAVLGAQYYADNMDKGFRCLANTAAYANDTSKTCYRLSQAEMELTTKSYSGESFLEPAAAGDTGSFGPIANTMGFVSVEMTEKYATNMPVAGEKQGDANYFAVTMTTTANIRPVSAAENECSAGIPRSTIKRVMRARTVIGPVQTH